jgi:hypothetical protein
LRAAAPSAAKAVAENKPVIPEVNRCATQKQDQNRVFQHSGKPPLICSSCGAAEAAPLQNKSKLKILRSLLECFFLFVLLISSFFVFRVAMEKNAGGLAAARFAGFAC